MCDTYGIELTEEHIEEFRKIADSDGEVGTGTGPDLGPDRWFRVTKLCRLR